MNLASTIDHTLLKPDSTKEAIEHLCEEAMTYGFATVCIPPYWVPTAKVALTSSKVGIATVIGFPHGTTSTFTKTAETRDAIASGATEIDMVMNIGALKSGDQATVEHDMASVVQAAGAEALVKVILETGSLTAEEKRSACKLATSAGAHFVKTSTGFGPGGASIADIALMRATVEPDMGVKASGGIRDRATATAMIEAGATRIGASSSIAIVTEDT